MSGESFALSSHESRSNSCLEPTLAPGLLKKLFGCQANEKVFPLLKEFLLYFVIKMAAIHTGRCFVRLREWYAQSLFPYSCDLISVTGINSFVEPNFLVYEVHYPPLDRALANFGAKLPFGAEKELLVQQCREKRIGRVQLCEEQVREAVGVHTSLGRLALINCRPR